MTGSLYCFVFGSIVLLSLLWKGSMRASEKKQNKAEPSSSSRARSRGEARGLNARAAYILGLQQTVGNRAMTTMLQQGYAENARSLFGSVKSPRSTSNPPVHRLSLILGHTDFEQSDLGNQ